MTRDEILDALRAEVPRRIDVVTPPWRGKHRGRCLIASRIGLEALRYFGVEAEPLVTVALSGNAVWVEWMADPKPPMPEAAWSVATDTIDDGTGYTGHMVLRVGGELLDLDARQWARPEKRILVPETVLVPLRAGGAEVWLDEGGILAYAPHPHPPAYKHSPDWRLPAKEAGPVIRRMKERMG